MKAVAACGEDADRHLRIDVRSRRVLLTLQSPDQAAVTDLDAALAHRISEALRADKLNTGPDIHADAPHSVQLLELAIDALDIAAIRPFWKAVFGYGDEPGAEGPTDPLIDPDFQGPAIWFQQMERERPQRNRIHFDLCVPHDEAPRQVEAALAAGGRFAVRPASSGVLGTRGRGGQRDLRDHMAGPSGRERRVSRVIRNPELVPALV